MNIKYENNRFNSSIFMITHFRFLCSTVRTSRYYMKNIALFGFDPPTQNSLYVTKSAKTGLICTSDYTHSVAMASTNNICKITC